MPKPPSKALGRELSEGDGAESMPVLEPVESSPDVEVIAAPCAVVVVAAAALEEVSACWVFEDFFVVVDSKSNCRAPRTGVGFGERSARMASSWKSSTSRRSSS